VRPRRAAREAEHRATRPRVPVRRAQGTTYEFASTRHTRNSEKVRISFVASISFLTDDYIP